MKFNFMVSKSVITKCGGSIRFGVSETILTLFSF